jgi:hypothetical protein
MARRMSLKAELYSRLKSSLASLWPSLLQMHLSNITELILTILTFFPSIVTIRAFEALQKVKKRYKLIRLADRSRCKALPGIPRLKPCRGRSSLKSIHPPALPVAYNGRMAIETNIHPSALSASRRLSLLVLVLLGGLTVITLLAGEKTIPLLQAYTPPCLFKHITHLPCLFCGFTRSIVTLLQGDLSASLRYHLLGLPVLAGSLGFTALNLANPHIATVILKAATRRAVIFGMMALLVAAWIWKLTGNPVFW